MLYYIPKVMIESIKVKMLPNPLHDGKRDKLSGEKKAAMTKDYKLFEIKNASKMLRLTINDLITSCLCSSLKQYFEDKGDTSCDKINICVPSSLRFSHYKTMKDIKLENKFAPIPLELPLYSDL